MSRLLFCLGLAWLCVGGVLRAAEETWSKITADHFTILTPANDAVARKWAIELEQFRRAMQAIIPVPVEKLRPVTVVIFKNERAMEPFVPLENGRPAKVGGFFVRSNDVNTIMLSLARNDREMRHVVFHEAVHWHLSAHEGYMPPWLAEGMAELYSSFELPDEKTYAFGATIKEHLALLNRGKLLPLAQLLNTGRDSILYNEGNRANIFYAESWAFVHFLFHGEFSPGREAVQRYVELMPTATSTEAAFTEAFGANYAAVEQRFHDYIKHGFARKYSYPRATEDIAKLLKFATASPAELELAKGSLLLGTRGAEVAEPILQKASELNPSDPRAWELLGHIAVSRKDYETAAKVLKRAAEAGSTSYLVYHNLAVSRMPEFAGLRLPGAYLDGATMDLAAADYRRAIAFAPAHIPSYEGLAGLMHGMATFVASDADLLVRGALQSPGNAMIEAGIAAAEVRAGRVSDGIARLERLCARHPESSAPGLVYARDILAIETIQREIEEINRLGQENKFEEILAIADRALARPLPPEHRQAMLEVRRRTADFLKLGTAITLANKGDEAGAKKLVDEIIASNPDRGVLEEARRLEKELTRRRAK